MGVQRLCPQGGLHEDECWLSLKGSRKKSGVFLSIMQSPCVQDGVSIGLAYRPVEDECWYRTETTRARMRLFNLVKNCKARAEAPARCTIPYCATVDLERLEILLAYGFTRNFRAFV
jgi:hypothetical protein